MNLAVGGNLGGNIPDDVNEALMEVDYVRYFSGEGEGNEGDNADDDQKEEEIEIDFEIDTTLKSPIGVVATEKSGGVVDVVWCNDSSVAADIYLVYVDNKIVGESAMPKVVSVVISTNGEHVFGVAAVVNEKVSFQTTETLNITTASK